MRSRSGTSSDSASRTTIARPGSERPPSMKLTWRWVVPGPQRELELAHPPPGAPVTQLGREGHTSQSPPLRHSLEGIARPSTIEDMNDATDLADRYVAVWNEPDTDRRRAAVHALWSDDAVAHPLPAAGDARPRRGARRHRRPRGARATTRSRTASPSPTTSSSRVAATCSAPPARPRGCATSSSCAGRWSRATARRRQRPADPAARRRRSDPARLSVRRVVDRARGAGPGVVGVDDEVVDEAWQRADALEPRRDVRQRQLEPGVSCAAACRRTRRRRRSSGDSPTSQVARRQMRRRARAAPRARSPAAPASDGRAR